MLPDAVEQRDVACVAPGGEPRNTDIDSCQEVRAKAIQSAQSRRAGDVKNIYVCTKVAAASALRRNGAMAQCRVAKRQLDRFRLFVFDF